MRQIRTPADYQIFAAEIASRASKDSEFRDLLLKDPRNTLADFKINPEVINEMINEDAFLREKFGDQTSDCVAISSCACTSSCCVSCWVASSADFGHPVFGRLDPQILVNPAREDLLRNLIERGHISSPRPQ